MSTRQGHTSHSDPIALRSREVLEQMTSQLLASRDWKTADQERLEKIKADLAKLVHWALHDHGDPDIIARILDCYRRCSVDIDDTSVLRRVRGVVKGELRKAGIDTAVPGVDPAIDAATIILTTRRTVQRMGGASSSTSAPGPALDRKPPPAPAPEPPPAKPKTVRVPAAEPPPAKPKTVRVPRPPTTKRRQAATPTEMRVVFDQVVALTLAAIQKSGRSVERPDYLAAIYNDPAKKARLLDQILASLPTAQRPLLEQASDGFFRDGFKGVYIERTDRLGNRRAHKR